MLFTVMVTVGACCFEMWSDICLECHRLYKWYTEGPNAVQQDHQESCWEYCTESVGEILGSLRNDCIKGCNGVLEYCQVRGDTENEGPDVSTPCHWWRFFARKNGLGTSSYSSQKYRADLAVPLFAEDRADAVALIREQPVAR